MERLPFGDGTRCVGGTTVRLYDPVLSTGGAFVKSVDFAQYGAELGAFVTAHFQCWYRDPAAGGAGFNPSDALRIRWIP